MYAFRRNFFLYTALGCGAFVLLTLVAMLFYPGGTYNEPSQQSYSFCENFFSDLGRVRAHDGARNPVASALFFIALNLVGITLVLFFLEFRQFFLNHRGSQIFSLFGALLAIGAGVCFAGVGYTPADVSLTAHGQFVLWAFRLFPLAVLFYLPVMFIDRRYPRMYAWVFAAFALMLVGYYFLLTEGPSFSSPEGLVIQVIGQKVIAYASILSIGIQALGAYKTMGKHLPDISRMQ